MPETSYSVSVTYTSDMQAEYEALYARNRKQLFNLYSFKNERARSEAPRDVVREKIGRSEVFLPVLGPQYGSLVPGTTISFVEDEINEAEGRASVEKMAFIKKVNERDPRQQQLVDRVSNGAVGMWAEFFDQTEEFAEKAYESLVEWSLEFEKTVRLKLESYLGGALRLFLAAAILCLVLMAAVSLLAVLGTITGSSAIACNLMLACVIGLAALIYSRFHEPPLGRKK